MSYAIALIVVSAISLAPVIIGIGMVILVIVCLFASRMKG